MPRTRTVFVLTLVYLAAARIMLAPIFNFGAIGSASFLGDARLLLWTLAWDNHAVLDRVPSLFNANIFHPAANALAYSEHVVGISVFTLPVYALTRNPVLAYNVVWLLCYFLTALAMHALAWRYTRDHVASTIAGMAGAFCFYRMFQGHGHLHMVWAFWIPLSLLVMERWVKTKQWPWIAALAGVMVAQALASWYQAVIIAVADGLFFVWLLSTERDVRTRLRTLFAQAFVGAAVSLAVVWPFARQYDVLTSGGIPEAAAGSADLLSFVIPPQNTFAGQWLMAQGSALPRWIWGEQTVYIGSITLLLALAGATLAVLRHDEGARRLRFFILLAASGVALALGPSPSERAAGEWGWTPLGLLMQLPWISLFRVPARFVGLVTLAVAVLAAAACARVHARFGALGRALTIFMMALVLTEFYVVNFPVGPPAPLKIPQPYQFLSTLPPGPVLSLPDYADTAEWFREADYQYYSTAHWLPIANGYSRAAPRGFRALMDRLKEFPAPESTDAMHEAGIRYVVFHASGYAEHAPAMINTAREGGFLLKMAAEGVYLFEVPSRR
jgi:hypothetical protein